MFRPRATTTGSARGLSGNWETKPPRPPAAPAGGWAVKSKAKISVTAIATLCMRRLQKRGSILSTLLDRSKKHQDSAASTQERNRSARPADSKPQRQRKQRHDKMTTRLQGDRLGSDHFPIHRELK